MSYRNDASTAYVPYQIRAERQEDYNIDLFDEGPGRHPPAPYCQPMGLQPLTDGHSPGAVAFTYKEGQPENGAERTGTKRPWYRTGWGITVIVIVIVVIIGGIVGGVIGGTHHSSSKSNVGKGSANNTSHNGGTTTTTQNTQNGNPSPSPPNSTQGTVTPPTPTGTIIGCCSTSSSIETQSLGSGGKGVIT